MTIDELKQYCNREFDNIDRILNELFSLYKPDKTECTLSERAAVAAFIMNVYSGIESILKQILIFDKLNIQDSPEWHEKVLRKASELGILLPEHYQILSRYLAFRNYFIYTYIFNIKWEDIKTLVDPIQDVVSKIRTEVEEYLQMI